MKMSAMAAGADVSKWDDDEKDKKENIPSVFERAREGMKKNRKTEGQKFKGLGLGYSSMEV